MNKMLPMPRFWAEAAGQIRIRRTLFGEFLIYLLLGLLSIFGQSLVIAIPTTGWMMEVGEDSMLEALNAGESIQSLIFKLMEDLPDWMTAVTLVGGGVMGVLAVIYCLKFQKRSLSSMDLCGKHKLMECLLGFVLGLALVGAVLGLGVAAGGFRLASSAPDLSRLGLLALVLLGCLIYGASLELLTRGYFAPTIGSRAPVAFALVISTLASALLQAGGSLFSLSVANHLLLGLLLGIWVIKRGNIWGACAMHAAWIFAENFLFDIAPVGSHGTIRVFEVDADLFRPLISGGEYGAANSICTTVVLLAAVAAVLALKAKDAVPVRTEASGEDEQHSNFL